MGLVSVRIGVLGAGSVGGFVGGAFARAGHEVTFVTRAVGAAPSPKRIHVSSRLLGEFDVSIEVVDRLAAPVDVVLIAVRTFQLDTALGAVDPAAIGDAIVVPLMNGIEHMSALRDRLGADRVVAGTIRVEAERIDADGVRQLTPFADVVLGPAATRDGARRALASALQEAGLGCSLAEDETTVLWTKLAMLTPLALATAAFGGPIGEVRSDSAWNERLMACCVEACAVARADGATVVAERVLETLAGLPAEMRSSMQKDLEAGRRLETDAIGGTVNRHGLAHGLPTPATDNLLQRISHRAGSVRQAAASGSPRQA
jgi:2-dehydropantoate 2-reductase